jgi:hypothetical protein
MKRSILVGRILPVCVLLIFGIAAGFAQGEESAQRDNSAHQQRRAVIYVMPNASTGPANDGSEVIADGAHNGREPQVAKIYHELQQSKNCQNFSENMIKEKADYFLLLQHGGGRGNRWAASDKEGTVIASGESFKLGTSVNDACVAIGKDWQQRQQSSARKAPDQELSR